MAAPRSVAKPGRHLPRGTSVDPASWGDDPLVAVGLPNSVLPVGGGVLEPRPGEGHSQSHRPGDMSSAAEIHLRRNCCCPEPPPSTAENKRNREKQLQLPIRICDDDEFQLF